MNFPFKQGERWVEIGGGESPIGIGENLDIRPMPTVDVVHDFRKPLPYADGELQGIFSKFSLEHVTLKELKLHLADVYRCLSSGGNFVAVTANLYEQARYIMSHKWDIDSVQMIFAGSPDYEFNYHKVGFSPSYICELMREAGFKRVIVSPWPAARTDMLVEATK
jgi:predicted SAM-dependent methyltransferase